MRIFVTGGVGFIGSHFAEKMLSLGHEVVVLDNLSNSSLSNLEAVRDSKQLEIVKADIREIDSVRRYSKGCETIVHLAANPDVRIGFKDTSVDFDVNIIGTRTLLEAVKDNHDAKRIIFASTSTVYGEPSIMPTPETYGPLVPISLYGSSKLAGESMVSGYCSLFKKEAVILRLANVIGARSNHGVIYDFINKLKKSTDSLRVLGDGRQQKSYLHVSDCVDALLAVIRKPLSHRVEYYNVGSSDSLDVISIAKIIIRQLGLDPDIPIITDDIEEGRGWKGDVKQMLLDSSKLKGTGWIPKYNSINAVEKATIETIHLTNK
jgi:UDP-glucose 4-epimerase